MSHSQFRDLALSVFEIEADAIKKLSSRLNEDFDTACQLCLNCRGRVVVLGMGKSGHIGNKIAASLASTGTPAFFVHPAEASHGDLGMIRTEDVVLAISYSGNTAELTNLLPIIKRLGSKLIGLTGNVNSTLGDYADICLNIAVDKEACPLNLAPTASTTATLAMGDALAVAILSARNFKPEDFARSHPGGSLGRRLLTTVGDLMHDQNTIPKVSLDTSVADAMLEMSSKNLGMTTVVNTQGTLEGIYTDGDIRRTIADKIDIFNTAISTRMTRNPKTITTNQLAETALQQMQENKITSLVVADEDQNIIGVLHIHDLLQAGFS